MAFSSSGVCFSGRPAEAADITQEVFARLWRELDEGREVLDVRPWLYRVASHLVISRGRAVARAHAAQPLVEDALERGINDCARERAIVMHGADYVNARTAKANGYLGRSLGCPALRPEVTREVINAAKNDGLFFACHPDSKWMANAEYLN
ncbi:hypothetical protein BH24ACI5_BH24ACI5_23610 [soil metagenome]